MLPPQINVVDRRKGLEEPVRRPRTAAIDIENDVDIAERIESIVVADLVEAEVALSGCQQPGGRHDEYLPATVVVVRRVTNELVE
jgi:hypothetical protein